MSDQAPKNPNVLFFLDTSSMAHCVVPLHTKSARHGWHVLAFAKKDYTGPGCQGELDTDRFRFATHRPDRRDDLLVRLFFSAFQRARESREKDVFFLVWKGTRSDELVKILEEDGHKAIVAHDTEEFHRGVRELETLQEQAPQAPPSSVSWASWARPTGSTLFAQTYGASVPE